MIEVSVQTILIFFFAAVIIGMLLNKPRGRD